MGRRKSRSVTIGYWYGLGFHAVFCHGPVDAVTEIIVGEKTAWSGSVDANTDLEISQPELFGGEEREGGVIGTARLRFGDRLQGADPYLESRLGAVPHFRGVLSLIFDGWVSAMNPYIKPWSIRARRTPASWYPDKAAIGQDANPAHIIRECLVDRAWGMGYPASDLDDPSFQAAADRLHAESFGLSLLWSKETSIEDFVLEVLHHVDGVLFVHPRTGKFVLRLARDDYDASSLPVLDPSNVLRIEEFSRPGWGEIVNQVTLVYRDPANADREASLTVQDIAAIELQGGIVATTLRYDGIGDATLAARVAMRELKQLSTPLAKVTLTANRRASGLTPGDLFRLQWPAYGIENLVMRVARIGHGTLTEGVVRIEAVEDVFGLPHAVFAAPPPTGWQDPVSAPAPCPAQLAYEVPWWQIVHDVVGELPSILSDLDPAEGMIAICGARPGADALDYQVVVREDGEWRDRGRESFAPTGLLAADLPQGATDISVGIVAATDHERIRRGDLAIVDEEWFEVIERSAGAVVLSRGALDTVPAAHAAGARIWIVQALFVRPEYTVGETPEFRLLPRTGRGQLPAELAPSVSRTIVGRFIRPYPPGNITVNGLRYPQAVAGDITIGWARRNRVTQTAYVVRQTEGDIAPEPGQTTRIRIYGGASLDELRREIGALDGTSVTWTLAEIATDGAALDGRIRIEIGSERTDAHGTYASLYRHDIAVDRSGYGLQWGRYYGGI